MDINDIDVDTSTEAIKAIPSAMYALLINEMTELNLHSEVRVINARRYDGDVERARDLYFRNRHYGYRPRDDERIAHSLDVHIHSHPQYAVDFNRH